MLKFGSEDTIVTRAYTGSTLRVLNNKYVKKYTDNPGLLEKISAKTTIRSLKDGVWKLHGGDDKDVDMEIQAFVVGQNIGSIDKLKPAGDVVREMVADATRIFV